MLYEVLIVKKLILNEKYSLQRCVASIVIMTIKQKVGQTVKILLGVTKVERPKRSFTFL